MSENAYNIDHLSRFHPSNNKKMRFATTFVTLPVIFFGLANAGYDTYPSVAHTASINGFADPIYAKLPDCAQGCVDQDTGVTPCPYWDTGCLCVIETFADLVAECVAESCSGADVSVATSLATSICSSAGVNSPYWYIASSLSSSLSVEAKLTATSSSETTSTSESRENKKASPASSAKTSTAVETSAAETEEASSKADVTTSNAASKATSKATSEATSKITSEVSSVELESSAVGDVSVTSATSETSSYGESAFASISASDSNIVTVNQTNNAGLNTKNSVLLTGGVAAALAVLI